MTPNQIADAILASRDLGHLSRATVLDIRTMIVDGIERARAEVGIVGEENLIDRMRVARRVAEWHIGDGDWAPLIVDAYTHPEEARAKLLNDQAEDVSL